MQSLLFAVVASAGLALGAVIGMRSMPPVRVLAALLAFASGALVAALAFELFEESFVQGGPIVSAAGLAAGALVYVMLDVWLDRQATAAGRSASGIVLLAGVLLDGIPENLALGTTLAAGAGSVALLVAIFVSNVPEALVGARSMCDNGRSVRFALVTWCGAAVVLGIAIVAGSLLLADVDESALSVILAFAGGAVLAALCTTLFPRAYRDGGPWVALATVAGFLLAFTLGSMAP
ncbi:MAG: zinc permease [Geodermatophilaceae bacterium]|nr:zinc permease [Geodermatophilaceae bacterium]MDQ3456803.1 zinc permease [Actinomycetota bacterium]